MKKKKNIDTELLIKICLVIILVIIFILIIMIINLNKDGLQSNENQDGNLIYTKDQTLAEVKVDDEIIEERENIQSLINELENDSSEKKYFDIYKLNYLKSFHESITLNTRLYISLEDKFSEIKSVYVDSGNSAYFVLKEDTDLYNKYGSEEKYKICDQVANIYVYDVDNEGYADVILLKLDGTAYVLEKEISQNKVINCKMVNGVNNAINVVGYIYDDGDKKMLKYSFIEMGDEMIDNEDDLFQKYMESYLNFLDTKIVGNSKIEKVINEYQVPGIESVYINSENTAYLKIDNDSELYNKYGEICKVVDNVANIYVCNIGNGGYADIIFLNLDGTAYVMKGYDIDKKGMISYEKVENVQDAINVISYVSGASQYLFVGIDGNYMK